MQVQNWGRRAAIAAVCGIAVGLVAPRLMAGPKESLRWLEKNDAVS